MVGLLDGNEVLFSIATEICLYLFPEVLNVLVSFVKMKGMQIFLKQGLESLQKH